MKGDVLALLDSENDGVRTHAIKFTESLIITLSPRTSDSDVPKRQENDISLDKVPKDHSYIRYGRTFLVDITFMLLKTKISSLKLLLLDSTEVLCEEGKTALERLLKFMVHPAISSINLTTALGSLATIARQRPMFMSEVVQAYETLHGKCFLSSVPTHQAARPENSLIFFKENIHIADMCDPNLFTNSLLCTFKQTCLQLWPSLRSAACGRT